MYSQAKGYRFEVTSLGIVALSIVLLFGLVLGEKASKVVDPTAYFDRPAIQASSPAAVSAPRASAAVDETPEARSSVSGDDAPVRPVRLTARLALGPTLSAAGLIEVFRRVDYRLGGVRAGEQSVPRILVDKVPSDLSKLQSPSERKRLFIKLMLPLVLKANEQIMDERRRLIALRDKSYGYFGGLTARDRAWLGSMSVRYGLNNPDVAALLRRVDVIPPSLALAQAAEESGWGTSRFVREGNALFGQHSFVRGSGLVPLERDDGEIHEIKSFDRLLDSVAAYMSNLNSHWAYDAFRQARETQRQTQDYLDGHALAGTLSHYSERREAYVRTIRSIIENNGLSALDRAQLGDRELMVEDESNV